MKVNRICRLFLMVNTKPRERELVKFFDEYTLHASEDRKNDSDFEDGEGQKVEETLNVSEQKRVGEFTENC